MEKQIFQVVCVVKSLEETLANWKRLVDFREDSIKDVSQETAGARCLYHGREVQVPVKAVRFDFGGIDLKLVEPLNREGDPYSDSLRAHGQGFHHLGIYAEDAAELAERCKGAKAPSYEEVSERGRYLLFDFTGEMGFAFTPWDRMTGPCAPRDPQGRTV